MTIEDLVNSLEDKEFVTIHKRDMPITDGFPYRNEKPLFDFYMEHGLRYYPLWDSPSEFVRVFRVGSTLHDLIDMITIPGLDDQLLKEICDG